MRNMIAAVAAGCLAWLFMYGYYCFRNTKIFSWKLFMKRLRTEEGLWMTAAAILGMSFSYGMAVHYELVFINCLRNELLFCWLLIIAMIDGREQIIPRPLTTAGYLCWLFFAAAAIIIGKASVLNVILFSLGGIAMGGGLFLLCRLLSKGGVGMGDVRMFSVIGLLYGMNYTFSIVFFTTLLMTIYGVVAALCKKKDMKAKVAMGPFTLTACILCFLLGI